jgi:hypothetical protein
VTDRNFNPRLRDSEGMPLVAPVRGSVQRPDFRAKGPQVDPGAVSAEAAARIEASAARAPRERMGGASPSQGFAIEALGRLVQQLSAELTVVRQRLSELEAQQRKPAA